MTLQEQFEAWAQEAPREWSIEKQSELGAFPGQYRDYHVYCAWEAWEARSVVKVLYDTELNAAGWKFVESLNEVSSELFNNCKPILKKCLVHWLTAKGFKVEEEQ